MLCKYSVLAIDHIIKKFKISIDNDIEKYNVREEKKEKEKAKETKEILKGLQEEQQNLINSEYGNQSRTSSRLSSNSEYGNQSRTNFRLSSNFV